MGEIATKSDLQALKQELLSAVEAMSLRQTIRLGSVIAVAVAILAAIIKL